jgi:hypothetical protein
VASLKDRIGCRIYGHAPNTVVSRKLQKSEGGDSLHVQIYSRNGACLRCGAEPVDPVLYHHPLDVVVDLESVHLTRDGVEVAMKVEAQKGGVADGRA